MLKVLHICSGNFYGGIEEVCRLIVAEQLKNNYYAEIVYFQKDFEPKLKIENKFLLKVNYLFKYIKFQNLKKFDILHNHSGGIIIDIINLLIFSKSSSFSHNHGCRIRVYELKKELKLKSFFKQQLAKQIYKKIPRISVSKFIQDLQNRYEQTNSANSILLCNPIKFSELSPTLKLVNKNKYQLGYIGRIVEYKGLEAIINFAVYEKKHGMNSKILICGPGEFSEELKNLIAKYQIYKLITFDNRYVKKRDFFQQIDIFISLPSFEPFGLTLYEAIFSGKPVITLQKKSIDESLLKYVWCIKNNTPEEIFGAIKDINQKISDIGKEYAGIQKYLQNNYSVKNYIKSLEKIYKN